MLNLIKRLERLKLVDNTSGLATENYYITNISGVENKIPHGTDLIQSYNHSQNIWDKL